MQVFRHILKQLLWGICFTLSILLITNNAFFTHIHKLPNGNIITHAHPFNKSENSNSTQHTHTDFQIFILQQLQLLVLLSLITIVFLQVQIILSVPAYKKHKLAGLILNLSSPRAPPVAG